MSNFRCPLFPPFSSPSPSPHLFFLSFPLPPYLLSLPPSLPPFPAQEKGTTQDFTFSLASNLSKKTSQLINALNSTPSSRKRHVSSEDQEANALLSRVETTSGVMMAAKLLLSWLDRNPSSLLEDYVTFRTQILRSALDLTGLLVGGVSLLVASCDPM